MFYATLHMDVVYVHEQEAIVSYMFGQLGMAWYCPKLWGNEANQATLLQSTLPCSTTFCW